ncbi:hypothetical protein D3C76_1584650 [compost metagenome]
MDAVDSRPQRGHNIRSDGIADHPGAGAVKAVLLQNLLQGLRRFVLAHEHAVTEKALQPHGPDFLLLMGHDAASIKVELVARRFQALQRGFHTRIGFHLQLIHGFAQGSQLFLLHHGGGAAV